MITVAKGWVSTKGRREWCEVRRRPNDPETHWFYYFSGPGSRIPKRVWREPNRIWALFNFPI